MIRKMNGFFGLILLSLLSGIFLSSCDECYQCDVYPEPYVNVKFIRISELELVNDTIATLVEQLAEQRKKEADLTADAPVEKIAVIKNAIDSLNAAKTKSEKRRNLLQSGSVRIDSIVSSVDRKLYFTDSATIHQFPLSMNDAISFFEIYLDGHSEVETLEVHYNTELVVEDSRGIIQANSITEPPISSFDAVDVSYRNDQKLANETTLYLYY